MVANVPIDNKIAVCETFQNAVRPTVRIVGGFGIAAAKPHCNLPLVSAPSNSWSVSRSFKPVQRMPVGSGTLEQTTFVSMR